MPITPINRVRTIAIKLQTNSNQLQTIYENSELKIGNDLIPNHKIISINSFIKNLKAYANISSVQEALLPNFTQEDSETDKLYKTLDIEWKSPRKQLTLYISSQPNAEFYKVGSLSLLNPAGYPYRIYNLMDLYTDNLAIELGNNSKVGISVDNVGYGLLSADDEVTIHGSYLEEIFVQSPDYFYTVGATVPTVPTIPTTPIVNEDNEMANWIVTAVDYTASAGEKVLAMVGQDEVTIKLPNNPSIGTTVKIGKYAIGNSENRTPVNVDVNSKVFDGGTPTNLSIDSTRQAIEFVYINENIGWNCFTAAMDLTIN